MPSWTMHEQKPCAWRLLAGGYSNQNYAFDFAGERYVLRIARVSNMDRQFEYDWYEQLPAVIGRRPLAYDLASGDMLSAWIDGELLVDVWQQQLTEQQTPAAVFARMGPRCVEYLLKLHHNMPATTRDYWRDVLQEVAADAPTYDLVSCHNDLNPWNIIVQPDGEWVTLDWEWVGLNDPVFDAVALHQGLELSAGLYAFCYAFLDDDSLGSQERVARSLSRYWQREKTWADRQISAGNRRAEIVAQAATAKDKLAQLDDIS